MSEAKEYIRSKECDNCGETYEVIKCPSQCDHCGHTGDCS